MLCKAANLLMELKAFSASTFTRRTHSVLGSPSIEHMACMAVPKPPTWPAQTCRGPDPSLISEDRRERKALAAIHRGTSPIPIGRTPGSLSRGINRQATKALTLSGCTHSLLPTAANALHKCRDADLYCVHSLLQP